MKIFAFLCALVGILFMSATPAAARPWAYTQLHNFCDQADCADGSSPLSGLVQDAHGNLFGTAETGGAHDDGVVFELKREGKSWTYKVLHDFCFNCGDGDFPSASLIVDVDGNLYGTTLGGGAHDCGIAFKLLRQTRKLKVLHDFCSGAADGDQPDQALSYFGKSSGQPYDGVSPLYGTTARGGAHQGGTVYSLTPSGGKWSYGTLYDFCALADCADGTAPSGELLVDPAGNLYGTTFLGGAAGGAGTVFELSSVGARTEMTQTVLHSFCAPEICSDGQGPIGALALTPQGDLYGVTENANGSEGGAIFKLTLDGGLWQESVPHVFCTGKCKDGYLPSGGLIADAEGNLYGVNELGGTGENGAGGGVAFRFSGTKLTPIYPFCSQANCADGRVPMGTLLLGRNGALFGVTSQGGPHSSAGAVFGLKP